MSVEKDIEKLENQIKDIKKKRVNLATKWDDLELEDTILDSEEEVIKDELRKLRKDNFEEGFKKWKEEELKSGKEVKPYQFTLTEDETLKARYIQNLYGGNSGAIGGGMDYIFTPTSIGEIITVKVKGKEYTIREL